jgi:hypothetical protein
MKSDCAFIEMTPSALRPTRKTAPRAHTGAACLSKGATLARQLRPGETLRVRGRTGMLWVTMEGDAQDYVLGVGNQACFARSGLLVIEGMSAENEMELVEETGR